MIFNLFSSPQKARSPEQLGFKEDPEISAFIDANLNDSSFDTGDAEDFTSSLLGAVNAGNLDQGTALSLINSRVAPSNSQFFTGDTFNNLLNSQLNPTRAEGIIGDAFTTNLFRPGTQSQRNELFAQARDAGVLNNPNELRQFAARQLARSPEGEAKRPFDREQLTAAAYYGRPVRNEQGVNTGQYAIFGDDVAKYDAFDEGKAKTNTFLNNYLNNSMGVA
jgi:hypothetical protein